MSDCSAESESASESEPESASPCSRAFSEPGQQLPPRLLRPLTVRCSSAEPVVLDSEMVDESSGAFCSEGGDPSAFHPGPASPSAPGCPLKLRLSGSPRVGVCDSRPASAEWMAPLRFRWCRSERGWPTLDGRPLVPGAEVRRVRDCWPARSVTCGRTPHGPSGRRRRTAMTQTGDRPGTAAIGVISRSLLARHTRPPRPAERTLFAAPRAASPLTNRRLIASRPDHPCC